MSMYVYADRRGDSKWTAHANPIACQRIMHRHAFVPQAHTPQAHPPGRPRTSRHPTRQMAGGGEGGGGHAGHHRSAGDRDLLRCTLRLRTTIRFFFSPSAGRAV